ncbi:MAG: response regulator [Methylococcales bacterium]|nr:response regulator [Methylococcales bacterium]
MATFPQLLIVDDVADNIKIAMNMLKEGGYDLSFALNGEQALSLIAQEPQRFDLILLDIMMPGLSGYDVCKALKANPDYRDIPIIFLTARADIDSIDEGFASGAVDYLTKPFHAEELLARVQTHLQLYQARQLLQQHNLSLRSELRFQKQRLLTELESEQREMICLLTELMESTSDETGKHIRRVAELSRLFARYYSALSEDDAEVLYHASPMHDIGKMTIPQAILHKPGALTEAEMHIMRQHTTNAYHLLRHSQRRLMKAAAIIAHEHHEKFDGSGYPRGLKGNDIHIYGRIVALVDVLDALTHRRCYKKPWPLEDALDLIREQQGKHFDPELVAILFDHLDSFRAILETA